MPRSINVIVVGGGYFASFHINAWLRLPGVNLCAIVEPDNNKHSALKDKTADTVTLITNSLSTAIDHTRPDIIDVATPPHTHAELITQASAANCPLIVCQKPFCGTLDAANDVFSSIKNSQSTVVVHENFRFQPWFRKIKAELEKGTLGTVLQATFRLRPGDGQGPHAYLERQPYFRTMKNFLIHETGIHYIDVFRYLFGEPDFLTAELRKLNPAIAGEDAGHFTFYYDNGLCAHFDGNRLIDHPTDNTRLTMGEMLIEGTEGSLSLLGNGDILQRSFGVKNWSVVSYDFADNDFGGDCVYHTQKHIIDHLQLHTRLENGIEDYLNNLQLEELVYKAAKLHTRMECKA